MLSVKKVGLQMLRQTHAAILDQDSTLYGLFAIISLFCKSQPFVQIVRFMDENDMHLPALAVCHNISYYPETKKLAAFTRDRFFSSLAASNRCKVSEEGSRMSVPVNEAAATTVLFQIIEGEASSSLTVVEMMELVAVAKFFMADPIVSALTVYFGAALQQMNAQEVGLTDKPVMLGASRRRFFVSVTYFLGLVRGYWRKVSATWA
jgi:hypothetical protein